ncbi:hypothetical protein ACHAQH_007661 [Verticillium albo-atrum]
MFKFVSDNVGGVGTKRKHSGKSCDACKKRHGDDPVISNDDSASVASATLPVEDTSVHARTPRPPSIREPAPSSTVSEGAYLRFVGDLSPEASFLANRNRDSGVQKPSRQGEVGVWLGQKPDDQGLRDDQQQDGNVLVEPGGGPAFRLNGLAGLKALYPYLRKECMLVLPSDYEFGLLSRLYFAKFDPLFPILHEEAIDQHDAMDAVALKQCICLQAALDPSMRPHLRLPHSAAVLSQLEFRSSIATALKHCLDMGFIRDKMVLLQVTVLMAFYTDRPSSSEISTFYAAQAVQLSHTLGLHLGWPGDSSSTEKSRRIFWCVWTLDRLNAAANGRPITIHQQDMNKRILEAVPEQLPSFRLCIGISQFLDAVISQYRPHATSDSRTLTDKFHSFETLVQEAEALDVGSALLDEASLELFHLSVVILQSRPQKHDDSSERVPSSTLQTFSASSIASIASEESKTSMTFWAVAPYAVSMATSVAYQNLRNSSIPHKRKRAYATFHSSCDILDELSKAFLSARTMAKLAKDTLQEVERVSVNRSRANKLSDSSRHSVAGDEEASGGGIHAAPAASQPDSREISRSVQQQRSWEETSSFPAVGSGSVYPGQAMLDPTQMPMDITPFESMDFTDVAGIFDDFDPSFHLNRIDALFSANLDPTMPFAPDAWLNDGALP